MKLLTTAEAAKKWGVSSSLVLKLAKSGRIPETVQIGTRWMIPDSAEKPIDGRTKKAKKTKETKESDSFFRYEVFHYKDEFSFSPPISKEELILKNSLNAFHSCHFALAKSILGDLFEKSESKYVRIIALHIICMNDIMLCEINRFFEHYEKLSSELREDFPHKLEMQEYLHEIDAALGYGDYYADIFEIRHDYCYEESFIPHLMMLSSVRLTFPNVKITLAELTSIETCCLYLDKTDDILNRQALHAYLSAGYAFLGLFDKANYHYNIVLIFAERYNLFYIPVEEYGYLKPVFKPSFSGFSREFKSKFLNLCDDVHNRYMCFFENINNDYLAKFLSHKDFILIYYAVKGYTSKEVGRMLNLSESAVGKRYGEIYSVLGVKNKLEITELYRKLISTPIPRGN